MRRFALLSLIPLFLATPALAQDAASAGAQLAAAGAFDSERISVEIVGSGPDVILIPGLSSSPEVWRSTVEAVPGFRYHLVHVRGFAGLAPGANGTGPVVGPVADEIARYIRDAGLSRPAVVGHSLGGSIAMTIATRNPDQVGRLMVVDMLPFIGAMFGGPAATPDSVRPMAEQVRAGIAGASGEERRAGVEQMIAQMINTEGRRAEAVEHSMTSDPATSAQAMYDIIVTNLGPDLARYSGPFKVLWVVPAGAPVTEDMMGIFYRGAYSTAPQADVEFIPNSAHFIMWDAPQRFQRELREFLTAR